MTHVVDGRVSRECPVCGASRVVSRFAARRVFAVDSETNGVLDRYSDATHVCSKCKRPLREE